MYFLFIPIVHNPSGHLSLRLIAPPAIASANLASGDLGGDAELERA
jgi:hypothetical protein